METEKINKATGKAKGLAGEFKKFISKGNVIDMAVGIIIGTAFTKIVSSLVSDIIMPAIGKLTGNISFTDMKLVLTEAVNELGETVIVKDAVTLNYGTFIDTIISFLLIALSVFILVKCVARLSRKKKEEPAPTPAPDPQLVLLTEIRDLIKEKE